MTIRGLPDTRAGGVGVPGGNAPRVSGVNLTFTPKISVGRYSGGIRVVNEQPPSRVGHKLSRFGRSSTASSPHGTVKPTRLEVRQNERDADARSSRWDPELLPRAEAGTESPSISQIRKLLARKIGTQYKPTGSVSNSPYDLRGGDYGVASFRGGRKGRY